jgi:hypothetical protein
MTSLATIAPFHPASVEASNLGIAALAGGARFTQYFLAPSGVTYGLVHITPQIARAWLTHNTQNRPLRDTAAARFMRDMVNDSWLENGDPIRFDTDSTLLDGQHRLKAIADSGTTQVCLVVAGLPNRAQDTMDDGTKRTMTDRLAFHEEASPQTLSAVLRYILLWEQGSRRVGTGGRYQPTVAESLEFLEQNRPVRTAAAAAERLKKTKYLSTATIGLAWWLFSRLDGKACEEFFARLADGQMLSEGNPIYELRERLADLNSGHSKPSRTYTLAITIKAWNALRDGRQIRLLRWSENESFPEPK